MNTNCFPLVSKINFPENLSNIRRDGVVVTGPGKLKCKFIFHVKFKGSIEGWKTVISICLQHAETIGMTSLAFPALGTGTASPRVFFCHYPQYPRV